jgi:DnaJ-domain-containing protein 1
MAGAALSIKLRCASWQQLATIYRRDLSRGSMFLKASTQPPLGTVVHIALELPSATVIELVGTIVKHVVDPQRGTGVDLQLEPLPTKSVWMIESALAAENTVASARSARAGEGGRAQTGNEANQVPVRPNTLSDGEEITAAEADLIRALETEAESLRKLNPFLVLGVGYETTDEAVRHAFGELTKRYHPDRFARYQSATLRQVAAEIFILIRDAYRRLADEKGRQQIIATLRQRVPNRLQTEPRGSGPPQRAGTGAARVAVPPPKPAPPDPSVAESPHDAPTNPSAKAAELAQAELAKSELAVPVERPTPSPLDKRDPRSFEPTRPMTPPAGVPTDRLPPGGQRRSGTTAVQEPVDTTVMEVLVEEGKLDEALTQYRLLAKKHPQDRGVRAGIELCEGLKALAERDRLEAAQRFEAALELDPSNERAARELAEMRRQATNERKGLLSRLMGKKEPPP